MTMEFRLGDDDGVDGIGSNGACTACWETNLAPVAQARMASASVTHEEGVGNHGSGGKLACAGDVFPNGAPAGRRHSCLGDRREISFAGRGARAVRSHAVAQARMASAGGCTVWENVRGKTSEFAANPVVADPLLGSMAGGVPDGSARV